MAHETLHLPVLPEAVLRYLPHQGIIVDGTLGIGGHTALLLARVQEEGEVLSVIGVDQDTQALERAKERLGDLPVTYVHGNFSEIKELLPDGVGQVNGILFDIGTSSFQIDTAERGFSFMHDGPLDMRMNAEAELTAADIINDWSERELADLIFQFGEERLSRKIARYIVEQRRTQEFTTTGQLAACVIRAYPAGAAKRIHPATRTFQALRIVVNAELDVLKEGIASALSILAPEGVLVVISFHSLEDRIVKYAFRDAATEGNFRILTKKPIEAEREEQRANPRSRSAKLRAIQAYLPED
jgi:16S rRNA (cytosine1402-N4)-methyltransferase